MSAPTISPAAPAEGILKTIMALRNLDISQESKFDFELPEGCREWPGPQYGEESPHPQFANAPKPRSSKRQQSQSPLIKAAKTPKPEPKSKALRSEPPQQHGPAPLRDPPLHLLTLPCELRDMIYDVLAPVRDGPMRAELRPAFTSRGPRRGYRKVIRRHPQEPTLALVNRQLRHEVLSVFYGTNGLIFKKSKEPQLDAFRMTAPSMLEKWNRGDASVFNASRYLRHVELHVEARNTSDWSILVKLRIKKTSEGYVFISPVLSAGNGEYCTCMESDAAHETLEMVAVVEKRSNKTAGLFGLFSKPDLRFKTTKDLVTIAAELASRRTMKLDTLTRPDEAGMYSMPKWTCTRCRKMHLTMVMGG